MLGLLVRSGQICQIWSSLSDWFGRRVWFKCLVNSFNDRTERSEWTEFDSTFWAGLVRSDLVSDWLGLLAILSDLVRSGLVWSGLVAAFGSSV